MTEKYLTLPAQIAGIDDRILLQAGEQNPASIVITTPEAQLPISLAQATQLTSNLECKNFELETAQKGLDQAYQQLKQTRSQMLQREKMAKIGYLIEDITDLINDSLEGAERERKIVLNLKSFSPLDAAEEQLADINKCLEDTINIAWSEIKDKATLERDFGDIPQILCRPQELNQVFLNILVNAGQAIEQDGLVVVRTSVSGNMLQIEISDNGSGIPENIRQRIFEPFFTTKEVGKGTGLEMSISYEIIQKHAGEIRLESTLGQGSCFTILLPLQCSAGEGEEI